MVEQAKAELEQVPRRTRGGRRPGGRGEGRGDRRPRRGCPGRGRVRPVEDRTRPGGRAVQKRVIDAQSREVVFKQFEAARGGEGRGRRPGGHRAPPCSASGQARRDQGGRPTCSPPPPEVKVADAAARGRGAGSGTPRITAPFDGRRDRPHVHTRHLAPPAPGGQGPLFTVARLDVVRVFVDVPEVAAEKAGAGGDGGGAGARAGRPEFTGTVTRTAGVVQPERAPSGRDRPAEREGAAAARDVRGRPDRRPSRRTPRCSRRRACCPPTRRTTPTSSRAARR